MKKMEKLGFYYHVEMGRVQGSLHTAGYLGVFLDSLAELVEVLYVFLHEVKDEQIYECDYQIKSQNIVWVNLGFKTPVWHRDLFHNRIIAPYIDTINSCDAFLIRSPSPLAPYFKKYLYQTILVYLIVGDYSESVRQNRKISLGEWIRNRYLLHNDRRFFRAVKDANVLVNSPVLLERYCRQTKHINLVKTTTISSSDFFYRHDTCQSDDIRILFTGRLSENKGVYDLLEAHRIIKQTNKKVSLHYVGWEDDLSKPVETKLKLRVSESKLNDSVFFHGKKKVGPELNEMYRNCDIYVLPSHEEGFPRTIWEAMANSIPVISTNVGAIPRYLTDNVNFLNTTPRDVNGLVNNIQYLIDNSQKRIELIENAIKLVHSNTLEFQSKFVIDLIKKRCNEKAN
jgi:glycosyltransferase involved in cell wall biosynthesis